MPDILSLGAANYNIQTIIVNIALTFALSFVIALVYKTTHKGLSYSQSFVFTLIIMSMIVSIVMMVIGNSLARAFGLLGAFSIIRFRTAVKDTKDTGYIFFALAIGMAVGTNNYIIALIGTALVLLAIFILHRTNFGSMRKHEYLLSFVLLANSAGNGYEAIFKKYLKISLLLNINSKRDGAASEMTYQVTLADAEKGNALVQELSGVPGVENVHLITSTEDVEY